MRILVIPSSRFRWRAPVLSVLVLGLAGGTRAAEPSQAAAGRTDEIMMSVGKAVIVDHPGEITRVSISNPEIADAVAVSTKEVLLNAKSPGVTTLVIWAKSGERNLFTLNVTPNAQQVEEQLQKTFPGEDIRVVTSAGTVSLIGRASSAEIAEKAAALAAPLGRTVVNNLAVQAPSDRQVVLKVRFAEVQRSAVQQLGVNLFSTGALNTPGSVTTGQFSPPRAATVEGTIGAPVTGYSTSFSLSDALNVFAFRPDLNLGATIRALQARNLIQILAEPNVIATSGKEAVFLVGGEFPVPVIQGGGNAGAVTIQFREFGIRLNFLPVVTPRETIKLHVRPEVSSLDFANGVTLAGFTIPALSTRRVETDVELKAGQSFVIAGLLDQRATENLTKIPGLASIPLLGNLFKSRSTTKNNSELLVLVTPEFPGPMEAGDKKPDIEFPLEFAPPPSEEKKK
jgi:pilus assembly protein CpaC